MKRVLLIAVTATLLSGCYSWRPIGRDPGPYLRETTVGHQRLLLAPDETSVVIRDWALAGPDSIRGTVYSGSGGRTIRPIALDDVVGVYEEHFDPLKTMGAAAAVWGVVSVVWLVAAIDSSPNSGWSWSWSMQR